MRIGMIWAEARGPEQSGDDGGAIGRDGDMPWHVPEDLAHFRAVTTGAPVIMGRRTWESLPERFRPLPGRANIVVTGDAAYAAPGATLAPSLEAAVLAAGAAASVSGATGSETATADRDAPGIAWIMGGGRLYRSAMPLADELVVTRIDLDVSDADTFAPGIGPEWRLVDAGEPLVSKTGLGYRFERWLRHGQ